MHYKIISLLQCFLTFKKMFNLPAKGNGFVLHQSATFATEMAQLSCRLV